MKMVEDKNNRKWKQSGVRGALKAAAAIIEGNAISQNMNKVSHWISETEAQTLLVQRRSWGSSCTQNKAASYISYLLLVKY